MNVRTLIQTLLHCDPDSPVAVVAEGKTHNLDRVVVGGTSLTAYLCDLYVGENEEAINAEEWERVPHPSLGDLLRKRDLRLSQEVVPPPPFYNRR